ncbi:sensor histidine kinase [Oceanicaulis sp.]|uniref:sensor histidine kinase n=1 Tax=Oceanicaulis sp. TaxID=1924941 RepID=UPI003BAA7D19
MRRYWALFAGLAGLIIITAIDIRVHWELRQQQSALLETISASRHETTQLYDELGFGGLIHNFKNYVIRGDASYRDAVRANAHALDVRLQRLQAYNAELGLDQDLTAVRDTITAYTDRLGVVQSGWADNVPIAELDAQVRVDDRPALDQLSEMDARLDDIMISGMDRLSRLSVTQSILTPSLQLLMLGFIILMSARMVANRLKAARQTRAHLADLSASLKTQSLTLERMRESHAALENFTALVAHDLKAPLRQTSMLLHLIQRATSDDDRSAHLNRARHSLNRANTLVESFLNLAQHNDQPPQTSLEDIGEIFRQAVDEIAFLHRKAPRHIQIEDLGEAYCDKDLIRQVAINLLTNALKYAKPDITLEVRVHAAREDTMLTVYVDDNGVGIPAEVSAELFRPLVRGDAAKQSKSSGRGLGLTLCQTIIAAHGGEISIGAREPRGASIQFTLPLAQPESMGA